MRTLAAAVLATVALCGTAGCGSARDGVEPAQRMTSTHEPTFRAPITTTAPTTSSPIRTTTVSATCADGPWAFGFTPVEPALGNRYLSVQVRNCGPRAAAVPAQPTVTVRDDSGNVVAVQWDWRPPRAGLTVRPGHDRWLRLHWHTSGRCDRGGTSLEIAIGPAKERLEDCLQLGGLSEVTGQPTTADGTWALAP